jgi:hypothetical protein
VIPPERQRAVARLAELGMSDPSIAAELGIGVYSVRRAREAAGAIPSGGTPVPPEKRIPLDPWIPPAEPSGTVYGTAWKALVREAEQLHDDGQRARWHRLRAVVRQVLGLAYGCSDEAYCVAAIKDKRSAEELAQAYLAVWERP